MTYKFFTPPIERAAERCVVYDINKDQYAFIFAVLGQLSDGYWEGSSRMEKYWKNMEVDFNDNNRILIIDVSSMGEESAKPFMTKESTLAWFRKKVEFLMREEKKDRQENPTWYEHEDLVGDVDNTVSYWGSPVGQNLTFNQIEQILKTNF